MKFVGTSVGSLQVILGMAQVLPYFHAFALKFVLNKQV